jgi:Arc/MetJ family transcription regulator
MRTNIDIDDTLLERAMETLGAKTKKAAVEEGLRRIVRAGEQARALEEMKGMGWEGDLDAMRRAWSRPRS